MKINELKKIIKEVVRESIREELGLLLLENIQNKNTQPNINKPKSNNISLTESYSSNMIQDSNPYKSFIEETAKNITSDDIINLKKYD